MEEMWRTIIGGMPGDCIFFFARDYIAIGPAGIVSSIASIPGLSKIRFMEGGFSFVAKLSVAS